MGRHELSSANPPGVKCKTCEVKIQFNLLIATDSLIIKAEPVS